MSIDVLNQLLSHYGKTHGIDGFMLDEDGYSCLAISSNDHAVVHIKYEADKNEVTLLAEIGKINHEQKYVLYPILLKANDSFAETKGATIAKAAGEDTITLAQRICVDHLNDERFAEFLENFRVNAIQWMQQMIQLSQGNFPEPKEIPSVSMQAFSASSFQQHIRA